MQTFLPYDDLHKSVSVLDYRRLGKQRVECWQLLQANLHGSGGWYNHPAARMWRGHEKLLVEYAIHACHEWRLRGYKDIMLPRFERMYDMLKDAPRPAWLGDVVFHASHRSNLLRKDPKWYCQFGWSETPDMSYVWPV
jgi:hypothetical protein